MPWTWPASAARRDPGERREGRGRRRRPVLPGTRQHRRAGRRLHVGARRGRRGGALPRPGCWTPPLASTALRFLPRDRWPEQPFPRQVSLLRAIGAGAARRALRSRANCRRRCPAPTWWSSTGREHRRRHGPVGPRRGAGRRRSHAPPPSACPNRPTAMRCPHARHPATGRWWSSCAIPNAARPRPTCCTPCSPPAPTPSSSTWAGPTSSAYPSRPRASPPSAPPAPAARLQRPSWSTPAPQSSRRTSRG